MGGDKAPPHSLRPAIKLPKPAPLPKKQGKGYPGPPLQHGSEFSSEYLDDWLQVKQLMKPVVLTLSGKDKYNAHTALRHMQSLYSAEHSISVVLSRNLRKHKAFTPWLKQGVTSPIPETVSFPSFPAKHICCLQFVAAQSHVHSQFQHFASFDVRVAGNQVRTLFDTGATVSCLSKSYADRLSLSITPPESNEAALIGLGGESSTLGTITCPVKIGKVHTSHTFIVVPNPIAGYQCLIGQNFLRDNHSCLQFSPERISLTFGEHENHRAVLTRKLSDSVAMLARTVASIATPVQQEFSPLSRKKDRSLQRDVMNGRAVGYLLQISSATGANRAQACDPRPGTDKELPSCVRTVIDKHSAPGGTLCGTIPDHTSVTGYECRIDLIEGCSPVHMRQYRLTPVEKEELITRVNEFIAKGWIEPSTAAWSSSVLFAPKPNRKLRFCVDFRGLNARTYRNKGPIPNQSELTDELSGANHFSALDLASGYYQLRMHPDSSPVTSFPTPFGLYQWKVMPMGLTNAPAIFQTAMNEILKTHILAGYCRVYLDDVIIYSKNIEEHAAHLDAVLNSSSAHNLFCQLPKCYWALPELKYLGHIVSGTGVRPDPAKVSALKDWPPPFDLIKSLQDESESVAAKSAYKKQIVHHCRRFLGFMNYFNRFIPKFSELAASLHDQTRDDAPVWTQKCTDSWNALRTALEAATLMHHPAFDKPFHAYGYFHYCDGRGYHARDRFNNVSNCLCST